MRAQVDRLGNQSGLAESRELRAGHRTVRQDAAVLFIPLLKAIEDPVDGKQKFKGVKLNLEVDGPEITLAVLGG